MAKVTRRTRYNVQPPKASGWVILLFKGILVSLIVSIVSILFLTIISLSTDSSVIDKYMQYIMVAITMLSIFTGSAYVAQKAESMVLILGIAIGISYVLISVGIGAELNYESISILVLLNKLAAGTAAGVLGSIVGANL